MDLLTVSIVAKNKVGFFMASPVLDLVLINLPITQLVSYLAN